MEAGAAELLAGEDSVCSAEGSRTEPEPDRAPEEDAAPPDEMCIRDRYLDFINIFLYVVRLLGMNSRSRNN